MAVIIAGAAIYRGIRQLNHAGRRVRQMGILNSVTHPVWLLGAILLAVFGQARYIIPLIVFVIGAHFLPIAKIMDRKIDYLLGPVAAVVALGMNHPAAVAGLGGAISTAAYAW